MYGEIMATNVKMEKEGREQELRDAIVRTIVSLGGACAPDLAGQLGSGTRAKDLIPVLNSLVEARVLRRRERDPRDHRDYQGPFQTVYELERQASQ